MLRPEDDDGATILSDGLSETDEEQQQLTSAQAAAIRADAKKYKCVTSALLFVTFLISVIVTTARYYGNANFLAEAEGGIFDPFGGKEKTKENQERFQKTLEYLNHYAVSHPSTLTDDGGYGLLEMYYSPQYSAALWISKYDSYRIPIPSIRSYHSWREEYPFLQRYALAVLYFATHGPDFWRLKMFFLNGRHECGWVNKFEDQYYGVYCGGDPDYDDGEVDVWEGNRTVTGLWFPPGNQMLGTLPPEVRHLRYLKIFSIAGEGVLYGTIPFQYGALKNLNYLRLADTSLNGEIPREFGELKNLNRLDLRKNGFSADTTKGDLDFLKEMTSLQLLYLDDNMDITGTIPDIGAHLPILEVLSLSNLNMYGELPPSLADLQKLSWLFLDDNNFEGSVSMVQNFSKLEYVHLENNMFEDVIDEHFFTKSNKLKQLDVSNCSFSGSIPWKLFHLPSLEVLDMSSNNLGFELPQNLGFFSSFEIFVTNLSFLSLHSNNITGSIPFSIQNLRELTTLDLSMNRFTGTIPMQIGNLEKLEDLFLGRNQFEEGPLPSWIRTMTQLKELSLKSASLNETIPEWLGELTKLKFLDLGENKLEDTIPQSLGNLTELMVLLLNDNKLKGELGLGELAKLEALLIDDNDLTGNTDEMCAHDIKYFIADCGNSTGGTLGAEVNCTCCTQCCADVNSTCNDDEWLGNHQGTWELGYNRIYWDFDDNGYVSPFINYNR
eukprot:CAMPEP_0183714332 /NCGR_PEP_ID=MMETSP0737-20130205/8879_1 /TAXON_ID=385413 /ORGANISM="Thalassiosira miniscula, Strain CCMP1093" /LENGTH=721 /DNA_ID=CAMNT_0025943239 /DNA_START=156 /DNA_END=2321 /DNA_ORIENTATION=-